MPANDKKTEKAGPSTLHPAPAQVRRSVGEIEAKIRFPRSVSPKARPPQKQRTKYISRISEAKAQVVKAKAAMSLSKNLKTEIKKDIKEAVDRLFSLLKEAESVPKPTLDSETETQTENREEKSCLDIERKLFKRMDEQEKLLKENKEEIMKIGTMVQEKQRQTSYAGVVTSAKRNW